MWALIIVILFYHQVVVRGNTTHTLDIHRIRDEQKGKGRAFGIRDSWGCSPPMSPSMGPWEGHLAFLNLGFLICETETVTPSIL